MNDSNMESILRRAPQPAPPAGLKAQLLVDIHLPKGESSGTVGASASTGIATGPTFWRRWLPALSFGLLLLGCFMMVGWQANQWWSLRQENDDLRASRPDVEALTATVESLQKRVAEVERKAVATREQDELVKLREKVAQLTAREQEIAIQQTENRRLRAEMSAGETGGEAEPDPFAQSQERAKRINCVSNLKQVGLALRMWQNEHGNLFPMDFQSASNEMNTPKILTCISDTGRQRARNWQEFDGSSVSYEFLNPGGSSSDPEAVLSRCPIHNNVGLSDGSVQQLGPQQRLELIDGKWRISRVAQP